MKKRSFSGVAMHPQEVKKGAPTIVGVCLSDRKLLPYERSSILSLNWEMRGHLGIRENESGSTSIVFVGNLAGVIEARKTVQFLAHFVSKVTGQRAVIRQLRDYRAVSSALAT